MSYLEIYNENIRDLLNPSSGHLELREDSKGQNIQVAGLSESTTKNTNEVRIHRYSRAAEIFWGFLPQTPSLSLTQTMTPYQFLGPYDIILPRPESF